jgi:acyl dehydratase
MMGHRDALSTLSVGAFSEIERVMAEDEAIALFTHLTLGDGGGPSSRGFLCGGLIQAAFSDLLGADVIPVCTSQSLRALGPAFAGDRVRVRIEITSVDPARALLTYVSTATIDERKVFVGEGTLRAELRKDS